MMQGRLPRSADTRASRRPCRSGGSRELCSLPYEGRGRVGEGCCWISANRDHPLPASPCLRRGRGQASGRDRQPLLVVAPRRREPQQCRQAEAGAEVHRPFQRRDRSEEHTSELQSLMRISYAVFCLKKQKNQELNTQTQQLRSSNTTDKN